jgi:hypothetical protein
MPTRNALVEESKAAMVSASTGLKLFQGFGMIMGMMMSTFPQALLGVYSLDFFDCPEEKRGVFSKPSSGCDATKNKAIAFNTFNGFACQILLNGMLCAALSRNGVNKKAQSVALLVTAATYAVFIVSDGIMTLNENWPAQMPKDGVYANFVMWTGFIIVALIAWKDSGSVTPNFQNMMPSGRFGMPLLAGCINLAMFGIPLTFFREQMVAQFGWEELMVGMPKHVDFFIMSILGNMGKMMIANVVTMLAVASVSDEDTIYRLIRAASMNGLFFLGSFSKDAVSNLLLGHVDPMRAVAFVSIFGVTYYQANAWAGAPFTLTKPTPYYSKK